MAESMRLPKAQGGKWARCAGGYVGTPLLAGAASLALLAGQPVQAGTLTIVPTFDSTITGASNAAQIEGAINTSISAIDSLYTTFDSTTVTVDFKTGPGSFLASTLGSPYVAGYSAYTGQLALDSAANPGNTVLSTALSNLSKGNDASGAAPIDAMSAQLRSLGFTAPGFQPGGFDAIVTLSSTQPLDYTRPTPAFPPTQYDAIGVIQHELDEVLGGGGAGSTLNQNGLCNTGAGNFACYGSTDLYRYSALNTPSFSQLAASSYLSVDGGKTNIVGFNQNTGIPMANWGDFGDFGPNIDACPGGGFGGPAGLIQDAFSCNNEQRENYTTASPEYTMLLSIGYDPVPVPAPLIGFGLPAFLAAGGLLFGAKLLQRGRRETVA
jgi:hypothetical protein